MKRLLFLLLLISGFAPAMAQDYVPDGELNELGDLITRKEIMLPMEDGTNLATDVFMPIVADTMAIKDLELDLGDLIGIPGQVITIPTLKFAEPGTQLYVYPDQDDPTSLPVFFSRTPYNKKGPELGQVGALLGYQSIRQDMRGRYASGGVYMPMYADAWDKTPYLNYGHPLDTTANKEANTHHDGAESIDLIASGLRLQGDSIVVDPTGASPLPYANNGKIGMFGASAEGNCQLSLAAAKKIDPNADRGLKCLLPVVGSGEFYHSTGHHNGMFRERIIDGWLRGQVEQYDYLDDNSDTSVYNHLHSLQDYGPNIPSSKLAAETAIDFWTVDNAAHYPNGGARAVMDISAAPLDANGNPDPNGSVSRYTNMEVPTYHLTGWWDIFIDGQIDTWQRMKRHTSETKPYQKIVIGPWAHQTIGSSQTGDMRGDNIYPDNVGEIIGASLDNIDVDNLDLGEIGKSEVIGWFRAWLGEPTMQLPPIDEWQYVADILGNEVYVKLPADTLEIPFVEFFNFIAGSGGLSEFPVKVKGLGVVDSNEVQYIDIPATGTNVVGLGGVVELPETESVEWDANKPGGKKDIRYYVVGPVNDGVSGVEGPTTGNYWVEADTFPKMDVTMETLYFHANGKLTQAPPTTDEGMLTYFADPDNPVLTHGGPNMIVSTPDRERDSQGQMDFTDPDYKNQVLTRPTTELDGEMYTDLLAFETPGTVVDSFSIIGYSNITLYAEAQPLGFQQLDSTNADYVVRVLDVYPDGRELYVYEGACNIRARQYAKGFTTDNIDNNAPWSNMVPDSVYEVTFESLPIAYTFGHDHKIKILISSSNYPRFQPCPNVPLNQGEFFRRRQFGNDPYEYDGQLVFPRKQLNSLHFSDVYQMKIEMPRVGKQFTTAREEVLDDEMPNANLLTVYPNPTSDYVGVRFSQQGEYRITLLDPTGKRVMQETLMDGGQLDVRHLPRGLYILNAESAAGEFVKSSKLVLR